MTQTLAGLQLLPEYQDTTIELEEKRGQHWYRVDGFPDLLPSVTTALKVIDKSGPLVGWAKRVTAEQFRDLLVEAWRNPDSELGRDWPKSDEDGEIEAWVERLATLSKKKPDQVRDAAADEGTTAHALISEILEGGNPSIPESLAVSVQGGLDFVLDHALTPVATERAIWHPRRRYAGTVDLIARDADGRLVVADWKRNSGLYDECGYQVAAYAQAISVLTGEMVATAYGVRLARDQEEADKMGRRYERKAVESIPGSGLTYLLAFHLWQEVKNPVWVNEARRKGDD